MEKKINEREWFLRNLKQSGVEQQDLVTAYKSMVRQIFDFTAPVYHSLLTEQQSKLLERLQNRALTIITGNTGMAGTNRSDLNISCLQDRRLELRY